MSEIREAMETIRSACGENGYGNGGPPQRIADAVLQAFKDKASVEHKAKRQEIEISLLRQLVDRRLIDTLDDWRELAYE